MRPRRLDAVTGLRPRRIHVGHAAPFFRWESKLDSRKVQGSAIRLGSLPHTVKQAHMGCSPTDAGLRSGGDGVSDGKTLRG